MKTPVFRSAFVAAALIAPAAPLSLAAQAPDAARLAELYEKRDCFTLREALAARPRDRAPETAFYRAFVAGAFNRPDESVAEARRFLAWEGSRAHPARRAEAEQILADNLVRAYRYAEAADAYTTLAPLLADSARRADAANAARVFDAFRGTAPQTVRFDGELRVRTSRDKAGLVTVPVSAGDSTIRFVFDTGAGLSTVTESTARAFGMRMIDRTVSVGTSSGRNTPARLAVAPELKLGSAILRDAVFLVMPDSALAFPQIDYAIHGIVGFPVITALGAVTLTREGDLVADPRPAAAEGEPSLCLLGLEPLVRVKVGPDALHFGLDTGAQGTSLFPPFHARYRTDVEARGTAQAVSVGGAGGSRQVSAYLYGPVALEVGGKTATLERVTVLREQTHERTRFAYGDIGQSFIRQFEAMTLDFRNMQIRFR